MRAAVGRWLAALRARALPRPGEDGTADDKKKPCPWGQKRVEAHRLHCFHVPPGQSRPAGAGQGSIWVNPAEGGQRALGRTQREDTTACGLA